jgi:ribosomal protein S2
VKEAEDLKMAQKMGGLSQKEADIQMMLAADVHLGTKNCDFQMERYVYKRRSDGNELFSLSLYFSFVDPGIFLLCPVCLEFF